MSNFGNNMKHFFIFCLLGILFSFKTFAQEEEQQAPTNNIDTTSIVEPEQVPTPEKLRMMGASEDQIKQVNAFQERKFGKQQQKILKQQPISLDKNYSNYNDSYYELFLHQLKLKAQKRKFLDILFS